MNYLPSNPLRLLYNYVMFTREETWHKLIELDVVEGEMPGDKWNLAGVDFGGIIFDELDLKGLDLSGADLHEANLKYLDLSNANLSGANLTRADLSGSILQRSNLSKADLLGADLSDAYLEGADLSNAVISEADFLAASLNNANLRNADMWYCKLNRANLSGADITGSLFFGVSTVDWVIDGIKAEYVYFSNDGEAHEADKRYFPGTRFEDLYRYMPTIDVVFKGMLDIKDLLVLSEIAEEIKREQEELGTEMVGSSKKGEFSHVQFQAKDEDALNKLEPLIEKKIKEAIDGKFPLKRIMPQISGLIPYEDDRQRLLESISAETPVNFTVNQYFIEKGSQMTNVQHSREVHVNTGNKYYIKYQQNTETIESMFAALIEVVRSEQAAGRESLASQTEELVAAIRKGVEKNKMQDIFDQVSNGLGTSAAAAGILTALKTFLGL